MNCEIFELSGHAGRYITDLEDIKSNRIPIPEHFTFITLAQTGNALTNIDQHYFYAMQRHLHRDLTHKCTIDSNSLLDEIIMRGYYGMYIQLKYTELVPYPEYLKSDLLNDNIAIMIVIDSGIDDEYEPYSLTIIEFIYKYYEILSEEKNKRLLEEYDNEIFQIINDLDLTNINIEERLTDLHIENITMIERIKIKKNWYVKIYNSSLPNFLFNFISKYSKDNNTWFYSGLLDLKNMRRLDFNGNPSKYDIECINESLKYNKLESINVNLNQLNDSITEINSDNTDEDAIIFFTEMTIDQSKLNRVSMETIMEELIIKYPNTGDKKYIFIILACNVVYLNRRMIMKSEELSLIRGYSDEYHKKYLKYKTKYITLKNKN